MSSNANSLDSNQKAIAQRQYREKEGERFIELQLSIHDVTGGREYPDTRHDILTTGESDCSLDIQLSNPHISHAEDHRA